ncbi:MAG: glutamyl-tRNA reductase [Chloroflexi bacterium]|nr:glutamyl-tRNA reductase [Chloroflexota bacterium]
MIVALIGLSHNTTPLSLRERLALGADDLPHALARVGSQTGNAVILSTCNRTELYFVAGQAQANQAAALELLAVATGASPRRVQRHTYFRLHDDAIRHLHRVSAGLDSMIFGEVEILGQVRTALQASAEAGVCNSVLCRLFHSAIRVGRRVHSETAICRHDRSVASAAVALAGRALGNLAGRRVLVLGAGEAGALTIRSLIKAGARDVAVANRTYRRAADVAHRLKATAVPLSRVPSLLPETDIVISASGAMAPLVGPEALTAAMERRRGQPMLLVDIAVPRNIDPAVRAISGVHLYDIDDLRLMCPVSPEDRAKEMAKAEAIMEEEVQRFLAWWRSLRAVPTIVALRRRLEDARQRELAKTFRRFPHLDPGQRDGIDALTRALIKKVLHQPLTHLKSRSHDQGYLAVTRELFGLEEVTAGQAEEPAT